MRHPRVLWIPVVAATLAVAYFFTPLGQWLTPQSLRGISPELYSLFYALATVVGIAGSPFSILAGAMFGNWKGALVILAGANFGASLSFFVARYLARDFVRAWVTKKFPRWEEGIERNGFFWMLWIRIIPAFPFVVVNYAAGTSSIRWRDYCLASLLGMAPATIVFTSLGAALGQAAQGVSLWDERVWKQPGLWLSLGLVIGIMILMRFLRGKK